MTTRFDLIRLGLDLCFSRCKNEANRPNLGRDMMAQSRDTETKEPNCELHSAREAKAFPERIPYTVEWYELGLTLLKHSAARELVFAGQGTRFSEIENLDFEKKNCVRCRSRVF